MPQDDEQNLKTLITHSRTIAVFTGAGMSTESGISDYRSQGGLWDRFQPVTLQEFISDEDKRKLYWTRKKEMYAEMEKARPNKGHQALVRLEKKGRLLGIITQNIDGLHALAGSTKLCEIHGTNREVICLNCRRISPYTDAQQRLLDGDPAPQCLECRGLLKPNTISFGQNLDPETLRRGVEWAQQCDLMLSIGSSLVVEPAASMPRFAKENGARLVIINREPTPIDANADLVLHSEIGDLLERVID